MLSKVALKEFFEENKIPLKGKCLLEEMAITSLFKASLLHGKAFSSFIIFSVISSNKDGLETYFEDWDDLYTCYSCFMTGYMGYKA
jgi:hypothetical protein